MLFINMIRNNVGLRMHPSYKHFHPEGQEQCLGRYCDRDSAAASIRADLMIQLSKPIRSRRLTQAQAAGLFGVTQPRVSDPVRGKIDRFSIDTLVAMLGHAGVRIQFTLARRSKVA
jgi:predicted XRE-type DNA-binding protein